MTDAASARLSLPFLAPGQAQKEMTHNEALQRLDLIVQPVAQSADLTAPPSTPVEGQCWIVAATPTGAWAGFAGALAQWTPGGWRFAMPAAGWRCHVLDRGAMLVHDGIVWRGDMVRADGFYIGDTRIVGPRQGAIAGPAGGTTIDAEARSTIAAILGMLRTHGLMDP